MSLFNIFYLSFFLCFLIGCKTKSQPIEQQSIEIAPINQPVISNGIESTFDTVTFIEKNKNNGRYVAASRDILQGEDLLYISPRELRIIRNEIFARYGYRFKDPVMQNYFGQQDWYKPLYDDVGKFITPLEKANIDFILEKEKTNPDISDEEQFKIVVDLIYSMGEWEEWNRPRMLAHKFFVSAFDHDPQSYRYDNQMQFPKTDKYIYLLYEHFLGCDDCSSIYSIYQFTKQGNMVNSYVLGDTDTYPVLIQKDMNLYEILFTLYNGSKSNISSESNFKELEPEHLHYDTIRHQFSFNADGQIQFKVEQYQVKRAP